MARITVEDCLTKENNRFSLVLLAAKRAKQLLNGSKLLVTESKNKSVVSALREIAAGKVRFMSAEEAAMAAAEEQRVEEERLSERSAQSETVSSSLPFAASTRSESSEAGAPAKASDDEDDDDDDDEVTQSANR